MKAKLKSILILSTKAILFAVALVCVSPNTFATIYPVVGNTEAVYLGNGFEAAATVNQLLSEAKSSVKIIISTWAVDSIGGNFIQTVRKLSDRAIPVKVIYDTDASGVETTGDLSCHAGKLLSDSSLLLAPEVICAKTIDKFSNGLSVADYIHQKMIIIDEGKPSMRIIVQGGNWTNTVNEFVDVYILLRPIQWQKPWAGQSMVSYYDKIWEEYSNLFSKLPVTEPSIDSLNTLKEFEPFRLNKTQQKKFRKSLKVIHRGPVAKAKLSNIQFHPKVQFVSSDLFENLNKERPGGFTYDRVNLPDDIAEVVAQKILTSKQALISNYGGEYSMRVKGAVQTVLADPNYALSIVTNSAAAELSIGPSHSKISAALMSTATNITLHQISSFLKEASNDKFSVRLSNHYRHSKLGIAGDTVWSGSANLTVASSTKNDEIMVFYEDPKMAQFMLKQVNDELTEAGVIEVNSYNIDELLSKTWSDLITRDLVQEYL